MKHPSLIPSAVARSDRANQAPILRAQGVVVLAGNRSKAALTAVEAWTLEINGLLARISCTCGVQTWAAAWKADTLGPQQPPTGLEGQRMPNKHASESPAAALAELGAWMLRGEESPPAKRGPMFGPMRKLGDSRSSARPALQTEVLER